MGPFRRNGRDRKSTGHGEPGSTASKPSDQAIPDDLASALAEALLQTAPTVDGCSRNTTPRSRRAPTASNHPSLRAGKLDDTIDGPDDGDTIDLVLPAHLGPTDAESAAAPSAAEVQPAQPTDTAQPDAGAADPENPTEASPTTADPDGSTVAAVSIDLVGPTAVTAQVLDQPIDLTDPDDGISLATDGPVDQSNALQPGRAPDETKPETGDEAIDSAGPSGTESAHEPNTPSDSEAETKADADEPEVDADEPATATLEREPSEQPEANDAVPTAEETEPAEQPEANDAVADVGETEPAEQLEANDAVPTAEETEPAEQLEGSDAVPIAEETGSAETSGAESPAEGAVSEVDEAEPTDANVATPVADGTEAAERPEDSDAVPIAEEIERAEAGEASSATDEAEATDDSESVDVGEPTAVPATEREADEATKEGTPADEAARPEPSDDGKADTDQPAAAMTEPDKGNEPATDADTTESIERAAADEAQPKRKTKTKLGIRHLWSGAAAAKPLTGTLLTVVATVLGVGIAVAQIMTDDERSAPPQLEVASSVSGAAPAGIGSGDGTVFGIGEQGWSGPISAPAAGRDLALGLLSTETPADQSDTTGQTVGGQISFSGGRLTGSLDITAIDTRPVRLRLSVVDDDQILAVHETMVRATSATTTVMLRDGENLLTGIPTSGAGATGEPVDIDWDLRSQRVPSTWPGSDSTTAELILTVDHGPAPDEESAFVRYHERLGPLAIDSSLFPSDDALAFMAFQTSRRGIYETTSTDPETLGCILSSVSAEDEEVARFTPTGVTALAIPCLFSTQFATSPAGTAAANGLTGFIADPDAAVGCIADGLGIEVTSLADYAALSSGDYTAWPQRLTDSYANVLESCIELRAFYLAQFEQYEYQRPTCPAEMTAYVLNTYSWNTFITSGILDADPALRQKNQARFDSFISTGYASVGCYVSQPA